MKKQRESPAICLCNGVGRPLLLPLLLLLLLLLLPLPPLLCCCCLVSAYGETNMYLSVSVCLYVCSRLTQEATNWQQPARRSFGGRGKLITVAGKTIKLNWESNGCRWQASREKALWRQMLLFDLRRTIVCCWKPFSASFAKNSASNSFRINYLAVRIYLLYLALHPQLVIQNLYWNNKRKKRGCKHLNACSQI